ncbi:hypothetical protein NL676_014421 [Syzygium grande]|nr:hypothetical protein NL676_014421 [Syzygium grande]
MVGKAVARARWKQRRVASSRTATASKNSRVVARTGEAVQNRGESSNGLSPEHKYEQQSEQGKVSRDKGNSARGFIGTAVAMAELLRARPRCGVPQWQWARQTVGGVAAARPMEVRLGRTKTGKRRAGEPARKQQRYRVTWRAAAGSSNGRADSGMWQGSGL